MPVSFFDQYLSTRTCYQRLNVANRVRAKLQQTLSKFHVIAHGSDPLQKQRPDAYAVASATGLKARAITTGLTQCKTTSADEVCSVEAYGGSFALPPNARGPQRTIEKLIMTDPSTTSRLDPHGLQVDLRSVLTA